MRFVKTMLIVALLFGVAGVRGEDASTDQQDQVRAQQQANQAYQEALAAQEAEYQALAMEYESLAQVEEEAQQDYRRAKGKLERERRREGKGARRHLEQLRLLKLLEFLDIREDQETEFIVQFRSLRRREQEMGEFRRSIILQLHDLIKDENSSDRELMKLAEQVQQLEEERRVQAAQFASAMRSTLSARQYAKIIVFQEVFEEQLLGQIGRFRNRPGGGFMPPGMLNDN